MTLDNSIWPALSAFIFLDKKISSDNNGVTHLKYRFNLIVDFLAGKDFNRANFILLIEYKKSQGCKNSYLNNIIKVGKYIHEYLLRTYQYDSGFGDFTYFKRERRMVDIMTPQEVKSIVELDYPYIRQRNEKNLKFRAIFLCLATCGLRIGELLNLKWENCTESILIIRQTKTDQERIIPMNPKLWQAISLLPKESDYVFSGSLEGKMSTSPTSWVETDSIDPLIKAVAPKINPAKSSCSFI